VKKALNTPADVKVSQLMSSEDLAKAVQISHSRDIDFNVQQFLDLYRGDEDLQQNLNKVLKAAKIVDSDQRGEIIKEMRLAVAQHAVTRSGLPYWIWFARTLVIFIAVVMFVPTAFVAIKCFMADNSSDTTPEDFYRFRLLQVWELNLAFHIASIISTFSAFYAIIEYDQSSDAYHQGYYVFYLIVVAEVIITGVWCSKMPEDHEITLESLCIGSLCIGDAMHWVLISCAFQAVHLLMVIFMLNQKTLWKWSYGSLSANRSSALYYIWPALLLIMPIIYDCIVLGNHSARSP
jgi:hypothetical protein